VVATTIPQARERILKFTGQFDFTLDAKGRASVPARIREVIEMYEMHNLTLRLIQFDGFPLVRAYPTIYYNENVLGKLKDLEGETAEETFEIMRLTANCHQVKVDGQGRLNIPIDLLKKLNINKEIRFVGMGNFFDIWHPETCEQFSAARLAARQNGQGNEGGSGNVSVNS